MLPVVVVVADFKALTTVFAAGPDYRMPWYSEVQPAGRPVSNTLVLQHIECCTCI